MRVKVDKLDIQTGDNSVFLTVGEPGTYREISSEVSPNGARIIAQALIAAAEEVEEAE